MREFIVWEAKLVATAEENRDQSNKMSKALLFALQSADLDFNMALMRLGKCYAVLSNM